MLNRTKHDISLIPTKTFFMGLRFAKFLAIDFTIKKSLVKIICKKRVNYYGNKTNKPIGIY